VYIQESKVSTCDIQPGRRPTGPALLRFVEEYRRRAGITVETSNVLRNEPASDDPPRDRTDEQREEEGT
jgi:formate dehydrogenase major subunit